jgi:hypothetical protein
MNGCKNECKKGCKSQVEMAGILKTKKKFARKMDTQDVKHLSLLFVKSKKRKKKMDSSQIRASPSQMTLKASRSAGQARIRPIVGE